MATRPVSVISISSQERQPRVCLWPLSPVLRVGEELRCLRQAGLSALHPPEKDPAGAQSGRQHGACQEEQGGDGEELPGVWGLSQGLAPLDTRALGLLLDM